MRMNAPYSLAYSMGMRAAKEHPGWEEGDIRQHAERAAYSMIYAVRMRVSVKERYMRELISAYITGTIEGRTGQKLSEDEWAAKFGHERSVYQRMMRGCSIAERKERER